MKRIWNRTQKGSGARRSRRGRMLPKCDDLEARLLLSSDTDYVLSGESWANPSRITYSFPPDGTWWDQGYNNLSAAMSAEFPDESWVRDIAKALQTWASVANINVIARARRRRNVQLRRPQPGNDPRFGDIRIGGYNFISCDRARPVPATSPRPTERPPRGTSRSTPGSTGA